MLVEEQLNFAKWLIQLKYEKCSPETSDVLEWTDGIVKLVELVYALAECKSFNYGNISLKTLFEELGKVFHIEIKNYSRTFKDIKDRADRTLFMDKLKEMLMQKIEEADKQ